jgi:hypothetical protein
MSKEVISGLSLAVKPTLVLYPAVYVSCLAAQEKGLVYGGWINANQSVQALESAIQQVLANSPVPNSNAWIVTACRDFGDTPLRALTTAEDIHTVASFFDEYGRLGVALLACIPQLDSEPIEIARKHLSHHYYGVFPNKRHFTHVYLDQEISHRVLEQLEENYSEDQAEYIRDAEMNVYEKSIRAALVEDYFFLNLDEFVHVFDRPL